MKPQFVVTGKTGRIGNSLKSALKKLGYECIGLDKDLTALDFLQPSSFDSSTKLIITSGWAPPREMTKDSLFNGNIQFIARLASKLQPFSQFPIVYLSTTSVYSNESEMDEDTGLFSVESAYGLSKLCGEKLLATFMPTARILSLRLPGVIGSGIENAFTYRLINQMRTERSIRLHSRNSLFNAVISIDEIVKFLADFDFNRCPVGLTTVNFAASNPISLEAYVSGISSALGLKAEITWTDGIPGNPIPLERLKIELKYETNSVETYFQLANTYYRYDN